MLIAIDGPSGSGKSSTARKVAEHLGLGYLDSGAMYRMIAVAWLQSGIPADEVEAITQLAYQADLRIATDPTKPEFRLDGDDVTATIREPQISESVSTIATIPAVREHLTKKMREIIAAHHRDMVVEGRDITTVVAPDADVRVLLVADPNARMARRKAELGEQVDQAGIEDQVLRRDRDDSTVSNFTDAAEGVTQIDSTELDLDQVVQRVVELAGQA